MNHADPWDEITRLEKQMEVELLGELKDARVKHRKGTPVNERMRSDRGLRDPQLEGEPVRRAAPESGRTVKPS